MRTITASIVLAVVGLAVGSAVAFFRVSSTSVPRIARDVLTGEQDDGNGKNAQSKDAPRVEVPEEKYNFGKMDGNSKGKHDYVFKNVGTKTLTLEKGETTCKCTVSKLEKTELAPGESAKVTLEWRGAGLSGDYRHSATIKTNDPNRPLVTLSIEGILTHAVRVLPREIVFSRLSDDETATGEANVLAYLPETLKIESTKWSDEDIAKAFSVVVEPLTEKEAKEADEEAKAGFRVKVTVKPGLPLGTFRQKLLMKTSYKTVPEVELPIVGMVDTDIAVIGRRWNSERNTLRIGKIESGAASKWKLLLIVRGPSRKEADFEVAEVFPKELKVDLTKPEEINAGTAVKVDMNLEIPADCRPMNHLGLGGSKMGYVVLKTGCTKTPEIKLYVEFAVLGG